MRNCTIVSKQCADFLIPYLSTAVGSGSNLLGKCGVSTLPSPCLPGFSFPLHPFAPLGPHPLNSATTWARPQQVLAQPDCLTLNFELKIMLLVTKSTINHLFVSQLENGIDTDAADQTDEYAIVRHRTEGPTDTLTDRSDNKHKWPYLTCHGNNGYKQNFGGLDNHSAQWQLQFCFHARIADIRCTNISSTQW